MTRLHLEKIDDVIHAKARLGIMSLLMSYENCDFSFLKKKLGLSDGNLGSHLKKLEEAAYIEMEKKFVNQKPKTICQTTEKGKRAYKEYLSALENLLYNTEQTNRKKE